MGSGPAPFKATQHLRSGTHERAHSTTLENSKHLRISSSPSASRRPNTSHPANSASRQLARPKTAPQSRPSHVPVLRSREILIPRLFDFTSTEATAAPTDRAKGIERNLLHRHTETRPWSVLYKNLATSRYAPAAKIVRDVELGKRVPSVKPRPKSSRWQNKVTAPAPRHVESRTVSVDDPEEMHVKPTAGYRHNSDASRNSVAGNIRGSRVKSLEDKLSIEVAGLTLKPAQSQVLTRYESEIPEVEYLESSVGQKRASVLTRRLTLA